MWRQHNMVQGQCCQLRGLRRSLGLSWWAMPNNHSYAHSKWRLLLVGSANTGANVRLEHRLLHGQPQTMRGLQWSLDPPEHLVNSASSEQDPPTFIPSSSHKSTPIDF